MKGMDVGLLFAMIFAIVFIGLLLVFGYNQITNMFCFNGVAQVDKAVKDLENEIANMYNLAQGSAKPFDPRIPAGSSICLLNTTDLSPSGTWLPNPDQAEIIRNRIAIDKANVWINYNCGDNKPTYTIAHVRAVNPAGYSGTGSFCAQSGDTIYIENAGDYVAASLE
jgi:hypothetical protein